MSQVLYSGVYSPCAAFPVKTVSVARSAAVEQDPDFCLLCTVKFFWRGVHSDPFRLVFAGLLCRRFVLLPVSAVHPAVELVAVEPDSGPRPRRLKTARSYCPVQRGPLDVAVPCGLFISEIGTHFYGSFHCSPLLPCADVCNVLPVLAYCTQKRSNWKETNCSIKAANSR